MIQRLAVILGAIAAAYFLAFGVLYLAGYRVYRVPSVSMQPTIRENEMVVGRLSESYRDRIARFDLVIYRTPHFPGQLIAKRVIGLPHEKVVIDQRGVFIEGKKLALPAAVTPDGLRLQKCSLTIPDNSVFILGDYTLNSADSRHLGPIPKSDILGYLVFKK